MRTCATLPVDLRSHRHVLCQLCLIGTQAVLSTSHAHCRFAGKSHPARGRSEPPPVARRGGRRDRLRARPISESSGDHRVSRDPDRVARRRAQGCRRLHAGRVRDHEHGAGVERQGHRAAALLAGAALRLFFRKVCRLRHARLDLALLSALPLVPFANFQGLVLWTVSLVCELLIVTAMSLFCVLSFTQVVPAFAVVAGFYLLSRSMAAMQIIAGAALQDPTLIDRVVNAVVELIALLLPALDGMTQTTWLLGSGPGVSTLGPVVGQTALYLVLICPAALFDLYRKNF